MPRFSEKLTAELTARKMGYRTLAKLIDPDNVESARRSVRRWANGQHTPSRGSRDVVTDALGLERGSLDSDPDEESPMTREQVDRVRDLVAELTGLLPSHSEIAA